MSCCQICGGNDGQTGIVHSDGIPVLDAAHLIPFKAKAWLDLTGRRADGGQVDSRNIRKHKNDVIRLSALLLPDFRLDLPDVIQKDMSKFFSSVEEPEKYIRVAANYGLSHAIPLDKLPTIATRLEAGKHAADEWNKGHGVGRQSRNDHELT